ncbi:MAG: hypothetical protein AAFO94_16790, partial [Bacteroidota bacterium]
MHVEITAVAFITHPNAIEALSIQFDTDRWSSLLDSMKRHGDDRLLATVQVDGQRFDSVGVRYKG